MYITNLYNNSIYVRTCSVNVVAMAILAEQVYLTNINIGVVLFKSYLLLLF